MKPAGGFEFALEEGAVEGVLKIAGAESGDGFDDLEAAEVGGVAHGRTPVAAPEGDVEHVGMGAEETNGGFAVVVMNCVEERAYDGVALNAGFEFGPIFEAVLARDDELGVVEEELGFRDGCWVGVVKARVAAGDAIERVWILCAKIF